MAPGGQRPVSSPVLAPAAPKAGGLLVHRCWAVALVLTMGQVLRSPPDSRTSQLSSAVLQSVGRFPSRLRAHWELWHCRAAREDGTMCPLAQEENNIRDSKCGLHGCIASQQAKWKIVKLNHLSQDPSGCDFKKKVFKIFMWLLVVGQGRSERGTKLKYRGHVGHKLAEGTWNTFNISHLLQDN